MAGSRMGCVGWLVLGSFVVLAGAELTEAVAHTGKRPNILFVLLDNVGKDWFRCYGSQENQTPNLDRLACTGMKVRNFYVTPVCSTTRVMLLTGRYPFRTGWHTHHDPAIYGGGYFDWNREVCLARVMKSAGYDTCIAGKWQINDLFDPEQKDALKKHGFDEHCVFPEGPKGHPAHKKRYWDAYIIQNGRRLDTTGRFGPDIFTDFLIGYMQRHRDRPFFAYYAAVLTHIPVVPTPHNKGQKQTPREQFAGMVRYADYLIGRLIAALDELAVPLETLRRRAARYLELDRARLTEYYDDIARDLQRRIERASDDARRASLEDKLAAAQAEREAKLADVEAKYRLRVELELINLQVITQPKRLLPVRIENRTARVERTVVWDPLLHRIEPLVCDVCGRAATRLTLCTGGHLAHAECLLAEQCVDCKRVYCCLCADQMSRCVVCDRPVCVHSLNRCRICGRATCREHVGLCHATDGQPARLPPPEPPKSAPPPPPVEKVEEKPAPPPTPPRAKKARRKTTARTARRAHRPVKKPPRAPVPYKIEVYVEPDAPVVNGFVLTKGRKQIAVRSWELTDDGLLVTCQCEKWYRCPADGTMLEPADVSGIEAQIEEQIEALRREYGIPTRRVFRHIIVHGAPRQVPRLVLRGEWKKR